MMAALAVIKMRDLSIINDVGSLEEESLGS